MTRNPLPQNCFPVEMLVNNDSAPHLPSFSKPSFFENEPELNQLLNTLFLRIALRKFTNEPWEESVSSTKKEWPELQEILLCTKCITRDDGEPVNCAFAIPATPVKQFDCDTFFKAIANAKDGKDLGRLVGIRNSPGELISDDHASTNKIPIP